MSLLYGLQSWHSLDETVVGSGSVWKSSVLTPQHDLTAQSAVASAAGKIGTAFQSTGVADELLAMDDPTKLRAGSGDFSICAWVRRTSNLSWSLAAGKWHAGSSNREYVLYMQNGASPIFSMYVSTDGAAAVALASSIDVVLNTWQFVCGIKSGTNGVIWVDAVKKTGTGLPASLYASNARFSVGGSWDGATSSSVIPGRVDLVGYWNRALSDAEVTELYNSGNGVDLSVGATAGRMSIGVSLGL